MRCPRCKSEDVKKSSAIYEQGVSKTSTSSKGIISSQETISAYGGSSDSIHITKLAEDHAPPGCGAEVGAIFVLYFIILIISVFIVDDFSQLLLVGFWGFVLSTVVGIIIAFANSDGRRAAEKNYEKQWYCFKCGFKFSKDGY